MAGRQEHERLIDTSAPSTPEETVIEISSDLELEEPHDRELRKNRQQRRRLNTRLIRAVLHSNADEVERALECGASPIARCQESMATVLHLAAVLGNKDILCRLMKEAMGGERGATVLRLRDAEGRMPQHLAAAADHLAALKVILDEDPSLVDAQTTTEDLEDELNGVPEIELDSYLHKHEDVTTRLLTVTEKSTVLHIAAKNNFIGICSYFLSKGARLDIVDIDGFNPLDVAGLMTKSAVPETDQSPKNVQKGHGMVKIVPFSGVTLGRESGRRHGTRQLLDENGARPSQLHLYVEQNDVGRIKQILSDASSDLSNLINGIGQKKPPVHLAVELKLIEPLRLLLEKDNSPVFRGDLVGRTPLHIAVEKEWSEGIELLLEYEPDLKLKNYNGDTVLHIAARKSNADMLRTLLACADKSDLEAINEDGFTPLLLAVQAGDVNCVEIMFDFNSSTIKAHQRNQDTHYNRNSIVHEAVKVNAVEILRLIRRKVIESNIFSPQYFGTYNNDGLTPLHMAVVHDAKSCFDVLLDFPVNVLAQVHRSNEEFRGSTVLHLAAKLGQCETLKAIVGHHKCRSLITSTDGKGHEPLILAALHGHSDCVTILLKNGANLAARDQASGKTAIDLIFYNLPQCVNILDEVMDSSIVMSDHREDSEKLQLTLRYDCLLADKKIEGRQLGITEAFIICKHEKLRRKFFLHPLTESFLFFKWKKLRKLYWLVVSIFFLHIAALTGFSLSQFAYNRPEYAFLFRCFLGLMVIPISLLELTNGTIDRNYLLVTETWIKWSVIFGSILVGFLPTYCSSLRYITSFTVLLSWIHLLFLFACNPRWVHVIMFFQVAANVLQVLSLFLFLLLGFAFAFFILFNGTYPFTSLGATFSKIVIMMVELDYNGVFGEEEVLSAPIAVLGRGLYLGFVVLVVMVLTNLMVGMSVTDVKELQNQGKSKGIAKKAQFLVLFEKICYRSRWIRWVKTHTTVSDSIIIRPNKLSNTPENPLPSDVTFSLLQAVMKRDDQASV